MQLEKKLKSKSAHQSVELLCKLLTNIIENPSDPKFRQVKRENQRVKELLTGNAHGEKLLNLVGFTLVDYHADFPDVKLQKAEHVYRLAPGIDISYIKDAKLELQGAYAELMADKEALKNRQ